ncbi:MAG TPA: hypothetical protein VF054_00155 [Micromonosporaceae bacterium]
MAAVPRRRRRFRPGEPAGTARGRSTDPDTATTEPLPGRAAPSAVTPGVHDPEPEPGHSDDREAERGLRGLVGGGGSQVGILAAMRARDAARPSDADLAAAEASLVIVRRGWVPRDDPPPRSTRQR